MKYQPPRNPSKKSLPLNVSQAENPLEHLQILQTPLNAMSGKGPHDERHIYAIRNGGIGAWDPFSPHDRDHLKHTKPLEQVSELFH